MRTTHLNKKTLMMPPANYQRPYIHDYLTDLGPQAFVIVLCGNKYLGLGLAAPGLALAAPGLALSSAVKTM